MGRRTFEHRGRLENQREIERKRTRFLGEWSDIAANEVDRLHQVEVQNGLMCDLFAQARPGVLIGGVALTTPANIESITCSQAGYTVQVTVGHTHFTSADVGKLICFPDTNSPTYSIVKILSVTSAPYDYMCTVDCSQTVASTLATLRNEINAFEHSDFSSCYLIHVGTQIYKLVDGGAAWEEIYPIGSAITNAKSHIEFLDNRAVIFGGAGVYLVNLTDEYYFKANNSPSALAMIAGTDFQPLDSRYNRRYLITKNRMSGTLPLFNDRSALAIEHETGSSTVNAGSDYVELGSDNKTGAQIYNYKLIFAPTLGGSALVADHDVCFAITFDSVAYTISFHHYGAFSDSTDLVTMATEMEAAIDYVLGPYGLKWKDDILPPWVVDQAAQTITMNINRGHDFSYFSTPSSVPAGYTDISGLTYLNAVSPVATLSKVYNSSSTGKVITNVGFAGNNDPYTHYSLWGTPNYQVSSGYNMDHVDDFVWLDDIPIMKSFTVAIGATTGYAYATVTASAGTFTKRDLYRKIRFVNDADKKYYMAKIITYTNSTTVVIQWWGSVPGVSGIDPGAIAKAYAIIGGTYLVIASTAGTLPGALTVSAVYNLSSYTPGIVQTDIKSSWSGWSVGQQVFCPDGNIVYIQVKTDANNYTVSGTATTAITGGAFSSTPGADNYTYIDYYYDDYEDSDLSARIGTLSISSRFMLAVPNGVTGIIVDGFMFAAETNNYYWSQLPNGKKYLICNYDPYNQTNKFPETITAFSKHPSMVGLYSKSKTAYIQTNLDGNVDIGGNRIFVLPNFTMVSNSLGVNNPREICYITESTAAVINQDSSVRSFDGYKYGEPPVTLNSIEKKIALLYNRMLVFDPNLGLIIAGATAADYDFNNKMYLFGLGGKMPSGAAEFTSVPFPELKVPHIVVDAVLNMLEAHYTAHSTPMRGIYEFDYDATQDIHQISPPAAYDIAWSLIESDDTGENQSYTIDHFESHASISPTTGALPMPTGLSVTLTLMNDIGATVTKVLSATTNTDLVAATLICGHRIRKKWEFNMAGIVLNDTLSYYKVTDKVNYVQSQDHVLGDLLVAPVAGYTRGYAKGYGLGDNAVLDIYNDSYTKITTKSISYVAGADGLSDSAYFVEDNNTPPNFGAQCYIHTKLFSSITGDFTFMFWGKKSAVNTFWRIIFGPNWASYSNITGQAGSLSVASTGSGFISLSCVDLSSSAYKHEVLVYDSATTTASLYQNGVLITSGVVDLTGHIGNDLLVDGGLRSFDVKLLNSKLTAAQILAYYNDVITNAGKIYLPMAV